MTVEQLDAVEDFLAGDNVIIRANYGSGKTTTIMHAYNEVECGSRRCVWSTIQAHEA
jgi:superfamily II DNA or RNA helicase